MVNSKTENQKTFVGSSRARKGKITAEDEIGEIKKSEARWLATSTNQPPERSHICKPGKVR